MKLGGEIKTPRLSVRDEYKSVQARTLHYVAAATAPQNWRRNKMPGGITTADFTLATS
jgi:hypothetical protein